MFLTIKAVELPQLTFEHGSTHLTVGFTYGRSIFEKLRHNRFFALIRSILEDVGVEWGQTILDKVAAAGN